MALITKEYIKLLEELHSRRKTFGTFGGRKELIPSLSSTIKKYNPKTFVDYGCGKGVLVQILNEEFGKCVGYDPAYEEFKALPKPAEMLISTDVLEHIEPDCLDTVLQHIDTLFTKVAYLYIATSPAAKTLADGRNAHLIVEEKEWWKKKILENSTAKLVFEEPIYQMAYFAKEKEKRPANKYIVVLER